MIKYLCDRCSALIEQPRARFTLRMELFTAFDGLEISNEEELKKRDIRSEIDALIKKLDKMDPKKIEREVYTRYEFDLCKKCRDELLEKLETRQIP